MSGDIFGHLPTWLVFLVTLAIIGVAMEISFRLARTKIPDDHDEQASSSTGFAIGALLGLVSFLLAFTFGIAASHYDARKKTVLEEANAIGTAYLRMDFLPDDASQKAAALLQEYTELRLEAAGTESQRDQFVAAIKRSEEIQLELWNLVVLAAKDNPSPNMALVVAALNNVIDVHTQRVTIGARNRIPVTIWISLYLVSSIGIAAATYRISQHTEKRSEYLFGLALAFASIITLISDLDDPRHGFLLIDQSAMVGLLSTMEALN